VLKTSLYTFSNSVDLDQRSTLFVIYELKVEFTSILHKDWPYFNLKQSIFKFSTKRAKNNFNQATIISLSEEGSGLDCSNTFFSDSRLKNGYHLLQKLVAILESYNILLNPRADVTNYKCLSPICLHIETYTKYIKKNMFYFVLILFGLIIYTSLSLHVHIVIYTLAIWFTYGFI